MRSLPNPKAPFPTLALLLAACALALAVDPAAADLVRLKNGQTLQGDVVEADGKVAIHSAVGTISLPSDIVLRVERGASLEQQAARRLASLPPGDVEGRVELALELDDAGAATLAQRIFAQVIDLDPEHEAARRALGYVRCGDRWLTADECHRQSGDVLYGGRWVSANERSLLETLERERRQRGLERLQASIQVEAARLQAAREATALQYGTTPGDPFGYDHDPYGYATSGVPLWTGWGASPYLYPYGGRLAPTPIGPSDRGGPGRSEHGLPVSGATGARHQGNQYLRGGQPAQPLVPQTRRHSLTPPGDGASLPASAPGASASARR